MHSCLGCHLLFFYRNYTGSVGFAGTEIPIYPGMVVRHMAAGIGLFLRHMVRDLFIFHRDDTGSVAECGLMVSGHPGMVGRCMAASP